MTAPGHRDDCECEECWTLVSIFPAPAHVMGELGHMIMVDRPTYAAIANGRDLATSIAYPHITEIDPRAASSQCVGCGAPTALGVFDCGRCPI